ncbi:MAG: Carnitine dehydratase [Mycobacterium sp.]|nr:Carnitine dehydratase [Mycobacterium sp.]
MGALDGIRVLELAGQGPGPHAAMLLGDWGADVIRVVRKAPDGTPSDLAGDAQLRNRTLVAADLKDAKDVAALLQLIADADVLIEGFRPGVTERLGLGPDECVATNPRLVYARMTGWGQDGPLAQSAGHDINYLSITGMLDSIGTSEHPVVPLNLLGDFGGGSMFLVAGILAALIERTRSGRGQVLDVAIVDGVNTLAQMFWTFRAMGIWHEQRANNILDGGAPYYGVYRCADGNHVGVGAIEQPFYAQLLAGLGMEPGELPDRDDPTQWSQLKSLFATAFAAKTRAQWVDVFAGTDACVTPVLSMSEAVDHPQLRARNTFGDVGGILQTMPAPMFSRSHPPEPDAPGTRVATVAAVAKRWRSEPVP